MTLNQMVNRMIAYEMSADTAPIARRVIRDERMRLQSAAQQRPMPRWELRRGARPQSLGAAIDEARRVCDMWSVDLREQGA